MKTLLNPARWLVVVALIALLAAVQMVGAQSRRLEAGDVKIEGVLTSYAGGQMVVAGETIDVRRARIEAGVVVGSHIEVYATPDLLGNWVASEVEVEDDGQSPNRAEISGTIQSINGSLISIGGRTYDVENARVRGTMAVGGIISLSLALDPLAEADAWNVTRVRALTDDDLRDDDNSDDDRHDDSDDDSNDDRGDDNGSDDLNDDHSEDRRGSDDDSNDDRGDDSGSDDSNDDHDDDHSGSPDDDHDDDDDSDDDGDDDGDDD